MEDIRWYYKLLDLSHQGPLTEDDMIHLIKEKSIDRETLVWNGTLPEWVKVSQTSLCSHLDTRYAPTFEVEPPPLPVCEVAPVEKLVTQDVTEKEISQTPAFPIIPEKNSEEAVEWYYSDGSQQHGPISENQLTRLIQERRITSKSSLWNSSMADWEPLSNTGFFSVLPSSASALPFTDAEYLIIVKKFTVLIRVFLGGILLVFLCGMFDFSQNLLIALEAVIGILFLIFVYQVADSLKSKFAWLFVVLCLIPLVSLLVLIFLNREVKKTLKLRGIKLGFLGVSSADLASLLKN